MNRTQKQLILVLVLFAGLLLAAFAPDLQRQAFDWLVVKKLTVLEGGATFGSDVTLQEDLAVTGDVTADDATIDDFTVTHLVNRSAFLRYQDVAASPSIYAATEVASTTTTITTSILGIDTPRNIVVTLASDAQRAAGNIVVAGIDARGNAASENLAMTAITDTETLTGNVPWQSITSFTIPTQTAAFTLTVAGGKKFGLPIIPEAAGDLYHLTVNATPQAAPTVSAVYGTFDPVSTPAANVDYNVWIKE